MKKIGVFYWSGTGNTEAMANAIASGISKEGVEFDLVNISESTKDVGDYESLIFGCPSMGNEELEESEFAPFFDQVESMLSGKNVALFGSYGWGDGEWMRTWQDRVSSAGAKLFEGEGLIVNETPDDEAIARCEEFASSFAKL